MVGCTCSVKRRVYRPWVYKRKAKKSYGKKRVYKRRVYKRKMSGKLKTRCKAYVARSNAYVQGLAEGRPLSEINRVAREQSRNVYLNSRQTRAANYINSLKRKLESVIGENEPLVSQA